MNLKNGGPLGFQQGVVNHTRAQPWIDCPLQQTYLPPMSLPSTYTVSAGKIPEFFKRIRDASPPPRLTHAQLTDWGFKSTNDRALVPLLKALGFLTSDGVPTARYQDYRNQSIPKKIMAEALREAYSEIFLVIIP